MFLIDCGEGTQMQLRKAKARFTATVDFPTPPFALDTKSVNLVPFIGVLINCFGGGFLLIIYSFFWS